MADQFPPNPLSPAAQAVLDAVLNETAPLSEQRQQRTNAAAALRAAVDHIDLLIERCASPQEAEGRSAVLDAFLAIATELEGANV
jgi:hypothetical protein